MLAAGNIQRSKIGRTPLDASVDFFAIAAPSSDRVYGPGGEVEAVRVLTWPLSTGFNLGWQATPFQKATFQYQFRFDGYVKDRTTAEAFVVPSSTVTQGLGGAWEYRRGGYSLLLNGTWFGRATWQPWGLRAVGRTPVDVASPEDVREVRRPVARLLPVGVPEDTPERRVVQRAATSIASANTSSGCSTIRGSTACRRPGVRYGELAMVRGSYSLDIFEQYRVDLFVDHAWGRDDPGRGLWDPLTGCRRGAQPARALEYDTSRRCRQERAAVALRRARLDDAADSVAEAAR